MVEVLEKEKRALPLLFISTIQHNELNYHDPSEPKCLVFSRALPYFY